MRGSASSLPKSCHYSIEHKLLGHYGVLFDPSVKGKRLVPILKEWAKAQLRYVAHEEETGYDNSEAGNNSLLVVAAHLTKGWSGIAECYVDRQPVHKEKGPAGQKKGASAGLADVYLSNEKHGYFIENKIVWVSPLGQKAPELTKRNDSKISAACAQAESLRVKSDDKESDLNDTNFRFLYGAFFVPHCYRVRRIKKLKA